MDPHSRAPKKNTSHGNEVLPEDTTQTAVIWSCFTFIRSGQNHLARHSERRKQTRQKEKRSGKIISRAVENREEWRTLVVKSSAVPPVIHTVKG